MSRSKIFFCILLVFTIINIGDFLSTVPIRSYETNLFINFNNGFILLLFTKIFFNILVWTIYYRNVYVNEFAAFMFVFAIVWVGFNAGYFGLFYNLSVANNPEVLDSAAEHIANNSNAYYIAVRNMFYVLPGILTMLVYFVHKCNMKHAVIKC